MNKHDWPLSMQHDTFNALKADMDMVLKTTLSNMELKGSDKAKMTVTVDISLDMDSAPDHSFSAYETTRNVIIPTFKHKVSSVMQIKSEKTGVLGGEFELVWDGENGQYLLRELTNGQRSFYDDDNDEEPQGNVISITGRAAAQLPPPAEDVEYIDLEPDDYSYDEPEDD